MSIEIDIQIASEFKPLPSEEQLTRWATAVLEQQQHPGSLTLRIVDEAEITELNHHYRGKQKPTNVLSFPMEAPSEEELALLGESDALLGDIIICAPIVAAEATAQGKTVEAHFAHMVVHGTLHLLGYDHVTPALADIMEPLEIEILSSMQFANPYEVKKSHE
ncbi:MAG: rRNA maturation RNase YbeY [Gammaproteobacteria bacterium]